VRTRRAQLVALVVAVVLLVGSVAATVAWTAGHDDDRHVGIGMGWGRWGWEDDGDRPWRGAGPMDGPMMGGPGTAGWMMGWGDGWGGSTRTITGSGPVDEQGARDAAQRWVEEYAAGASLGEPERMPWGYWFRATEDDTAAAVIMVWDDTGTVVGHLLGAWAPAAD
jgi:hypothetical protein